MDKSAAKHKHTGPDGSTTSHIMMCQISLTPFSWPCWCPLESR